MTCFLKARGVAVAATFLFAMSGGAAAAATTSTLTDVPNFNLAAHALPSVAPAFTVSPAPLADRPAPIATSPAPLSAPKGPMVVVKGLDDAPTAALASAALPLAALVAANGAGMLDAEAQCLATAVYFESKGEPLEGQLAVAQVVINRAHSGRFPTTLCGVVRQHKQFSFVRRGAFPKFNAGCEAWRRARAIAQIAQQRLATSLPNNVLWYHADYVTPRWRSALIKAVKIGQHIFYRT